MAKQIFLNLPVADLPRSMAFFRALGFSFNAEWTDEHAACMVMGDNLFTMLLTRERFQSFTPKPVADAKTCSEVLICLAVDSRAEVDQKVAAALAAGGSVYKDAEDHGFMYAHGFQDLDGHIWELAYMAGQDAA